MDQLAKPHIQAQIDLPDAYGRTPLYWASMKGDAYAVEKLLHAGANPNCQAYGKDTPLHIAAFSQNPQVYESLVRGGADVLFVNEWGDAALNCACNHRDVVACIKPLIQSGAKLDHRNQHGLTPLADAATRNNLEIGSFLLNQNANMYIADQRGDTPLFHAILSGHHYFVKLLLQKGDNCTNITAHGATILHYTAEHGDIETANILASALLRGVDPDATDFKGRTAMQVLEQRRVIEDGFKEAFAELLESTKSAHSADPDDS